MPDLMCDWQEMSDEGKLGMGGGGHSSTKMALNPKKKIPFKLSEKIALSHNTRLFRFALQTPEHTLGLPIGQHMFFYAKVSTDFGTHLHISPIAHSELVLCGVSCWIEGKEHSV